MNRVECTIRLSELTIEQLTAEAGRQQTKPRTLAREIIERYLEEKIVGNVKARAV